MPVLHYLRPYANLLLVIVTIVYVFFTWRTLKTMERANRRGLEVEHLSEIKTAVLDPILNWLRKVRTSLEKNPTSADSLIAIGTEPVPRSSDHIEDQAYNFRWQMQPLPELWEPEEGLLRTALFGDARSRHFQATLRQLDSFLKGWHQFLDDLTAFAKKCAAQIQAETSLQPSSPTASPQEFANGDCLAESCVWQILSGKPLHFDFRASQPGLITVVDQRDRRHIARSRDGAAIKTWVQQGSERVKEEWERSGLEQRSDSLLREAKGLGEAIERLRLSHFLPKDCEYVSGRRWRLLPRPKRHLDRE